CGLPHPGVVPCASDEVPDFFSGCFGLGSRDLQPGDLIAAVENALPEGRGRRQFYLGVEFVRPDSNGAGASPRLEDWQKKIVEVYPHVEEMAVRPAPNVNLLPEGSLAVRIHSVGGWGAMTMGKNLTITLFDLLGMHVKSNPKYGSEKKGQPTTFYGVFAHEPIRTNCELKHVDVVLSPDPNVFRHSNPLAGLAEDGIFVVQHDGTPEALWQSLPPWVQQLIRRRRIRVFHLDAFAIARAETDEPDLQFRMQGAAFQGAFFKTSPIMAREGLDEARLFEAMTKQLKKKFGHRGAQVVEDNLRVIRRGWEEVRELDWKNHSDAVTETKPIRRSIEPPWYLSEARTAEGMGDAFRFLGQVCSLYGEGQDPIADPFAAISAIPAATGVLRDMTNIRFEVPDFIAERCTGCGQCWTQCPDAAIPGLVSEIEDVVRAGVYTATDGRPSETLRRIVAALAETSRQLLRESGEYKSFSNVATRAYEKVAAGLALGEQERHALDEEFDVVAHTLAEFPIARTAPFFTVPERRESGSGGLLTVTVNPYACKGCNLCVEVCPDEALVAIKQDEPVVQKLRRNWEVWEKLPDTPQRFVQITNLDEGIGVLHTLMLKKNNFHSMVGGDGSCMGCGEKTGVHLIVSAIEAAVQPRVVKFVERLDGLVHQLEHKAAELLMVSADLDQVAEAGALHLDVEVKGENRARLGRISKLLKTLKDLRWRYTNGPTGRGRASLGITNSTGCSSVWGSTYPYNPYPYPWTNHLFQDAPSIAIGIFEGLMRKMADGFAAVRKAELEIKDAYDPAVDDRLFESFDWRAFDDEEFRLCPPILTIGGDGAMLDIGFQNVSRLMASGKPIRVMVLDTQVYSNTGGQACTSGFHGQVSDMAAYGAARHGKEENRKEMALIAMAHRGTYVLQSSQAFPAHLIGGVLRGLNSRRPAIFNIYSPCQAEHGLPDSGSATAAKLALESRAFPYMVYDPDRGTTTAERLDLDGNPELESIWPSYELSYTADDGSTQTMTLPLTIADWAASEPRFGRHFKPVPREHWNETMMPFHELLELETAERAGKVPFIHVHGEGGKLGRLRVSEEMVELAEDRLDLWHELRELAGIEVSEKVGKKLRKPLEREYEKQLAALRKEYEQKLAELKASYPEKITRRIAEALVSGGAGLAGFARLRPSRCRLRH
ncbi:MAG: 4Fe-4S binding protein, partial [Thermoanaerobaculia bacterium]|nr:4Fe-4S binding protein [Thermoanaerobaculia bacterium]